MRKFHKELFKRTVTDYLPGHKHTNYHHNQMRYHKEIKLAIFTPFATKCGKKFPFLCEYRYTVIRSPLTDININMYYIFSLESKDTLLTHNDSMVQKIDEVKATIRFQMKKVRKSVPGWCLNVTSLSLSLSLSLSMQVLCLAVAIGHIEMSEDDLVGNIHLAINFLVSLLKKN